MINSTLQCLLIGKKIQVYNELVGLMLRLDLKLEINNVNADQASLIKVLKQMPTAGLVFFSDHAPFSLKRLSQLVAQHSPDSIVVILSEKTQTTALSKPFNGTYFAKLFFDIHSKETSLFLQYLVQIASLKVSLRTRNHLLELSQKRYQELVDSNKKAITQITYMLSSHKNSDVLTSRSSPTPTNKKTDSASILKEIINRKEATIATQSLVALKNNNNELKTPFILSLIVAPAQRKGVNDLLFRSSTTDVRNKKQIFWKKVMLSRIFEILSVKQTLKHQLMIPINETAISNKMFVVWLISELQKIKSRPSNLAFMIPCQIDKSKTKISIEFIKQLRVNKCSIVLDNFSVFPESLRMLKQIKPDYVRLSLPWVREIEDNNDREIALAKLIQQLEQRQIKVIAPCSFSKNMKKLFIISGASYCQEKPSKTI